MQFNVAGLLKGPPGASRSYTIDAQVPRLDDAQADHVWGRVSLMRTDAGVWVNASLEVGTTCCCSRCLREFSTVVPLELDDTYYPTVDIHSGTGLSLPKDVESDCAIDARHMLDITEAVRQAVVVSLPMKPLCRSECAGLCPDCGVDLNEEACDCGSRRRDARWGPLLKLASSEVRG